MDDQQALVVTFTTSGDLRVEERLKLKDNLGDAYRAATGTTEAIGVDHGERRDA